MAASNETVDDAGPFVVLAACSGEPRRPVVVTRRLRRAT
jgi:hypothetical protein